MFYLLLFYGMQDIGETSMIINVDREPTLSLYYLGGVVLQILKKQSFSYIDDLYKEVMKNINQDIHIDFLYYTLDWLYILSAIKINEGKVSICEYIG